ncbi:B12-binding domain-containing radical SAM protein [Nonomuraea candida]|uniref:B12-binding domain-containing radical SAM protein n=1 Tax=Nonomuraea candida TaxID=359159 RepID=UPI00069393D0|nr:radical SAM protein [Nonomuraea candida]
MEILLVFPPQWSAFQPALSLPSLSAWLKRAGFSVDSVDGNVLFYEWLLSDECAKLLLEQVAAGGDLSRDARTAFGAIFERVHEFRGDLARLRQSANDDRRPDKDAYFEAHYIGVKSLATYLDAVSRVCGEFTVSPYEFRLRSGNLSSSELERRVAEPHPVIGEFVRRLVAEEILAPAPGSIGMSCIGQEQLYFTLLIGSAIKQVSDAPVMVGGTIFSRIFERGALQPHWFGRFFDVIVRNEGEKPAERMLANLRAGDPLTEAVPGIVYREERQIVASPPCPPLRPSELPVPDFDDMPLGRYLSAETTLPLLSSRGCYWGRCEFCHHGMVYGEKYAGYAVADVQRAIETLADRYGVRNFAFNDEAIPPKIARCLGENLPSHAETGWCFTGLMKFEDFFRRADFENAHRIGFRSLYVGLESASERVLSLMRKNTRREVMLRNLRDATESGIWMHCFLFFGFPGETEEDAEETFRFVMENSDIISSFGAGAFSLEHNAPIFHHLEDFGVRIKPTGMGDVDVYYDYEVSSGVDAVRALEWMRRLQDASSTVPGYVGAGWVPRELLLCVLSHMTPAELVERCRMVRDMGGLPPAIKVRDLVSRVTHPDRAGSELVINRVSGRVLRIDGGARRAFDACCETGLSVTEIKELAPLLFEGLVPPGQNTPEAAPA